MVSSVSRMIAILMGSTLILEILILLRTSPGIVPIVKPGKMPETHQWNQLSSVLTVNEVNIIVVIFARRKHSDGICTVSTSKQRVITAETATELPGLRTNRKRRLTIGIPTVKRQGGSYFLTMLDTMLNKTSPEQLSEIIFVICLAENNNKTWKEETGKYLNNKYRKHVERGSLIIIDIPLSFYMNMYSFEDRKKSWQVKQNYDYAYMMKYSRHLSEYYMQMEDDVTTTDDYYHAILNYIKYQGSSKWVCLEFSRLGFIGKLYHSSDLADLADMLLMFNSTAPVDVTYLNFNYLRGQFGRLISMPTLFQHLGINSSLAGKIQMLKDTEFKDDLPEKELNGDNPPATLLTSLATNINFAPDLAYSNKRGYFWSSRRPQPNDHFTVIFDKPQLLSGVVIKTGLETVPNDMFYSAVVESSSTLNGTNKCSDYDVIGVFQNGIANITKAEIKEQIGSSKTMCLKVRVTKAHNYWVTIKEIAVFIK